MMISRASRPRILHFHAPQAWTYNDSDNKLHARAHAAVRVSLSGEPQDRSEGTRAESGLVSDPFVKIKGGVSWCLHARV